MADAFLEDLRTAQQGRLKIFLGMAAGVGKTVAMLRDARRLRDEGVDVVCGFVETHGRAETDAELGDLPIVRRRTIAYRGVPLEELDLDAVLARHPDVAVVDELAHTNVPGSRHEKRYRDVEALLDAGISVLSALNVQHLESLHDMVLRATGIDVRERVPDRILHRADEIVVVDVAPAELQERLRAGKIYTPAKVERALQGFFRAENLTALRQLALREVANAVELRARARLRASRAQDAPAPGADDGVADAERVMVSMSSIPSATLRLMRHGARLAGGINSRWFVVYVRTHGEAPERIASPVLRSLTENIRLARELGAEVVRLEGADVAAALAAFAREHRITHAVFGRTRQPIWRERLFGSLLDRFMRLAPEVDVLVVGSRGDDTPAPKGPP
ncbi:MAG: Osmosensitive channel histidine kinase KdpD [Myxococcaceae bacterium]|nr:Osmosensitive channel histidine kinase KdpD [Myxococcaceae bacterium]